VSWISSSVPSSSNLELDLELDLIGDVHLDAHAVALELDVVVAGQRVGQRVEARRGGLASDAFLLADLEEVHAATVKPAAQTGITRWG
jgi:hypothetical protein